MHEIHAIRQETIARKAMYSLRNTVDRAYEMASGEKAKQYVGYIPTDVSSEEYVRDYKMLVDAGVALAIPRGSRRVMTVEGNEQLSEDERNQKIQEIFKDSPVHQKISAVAKEIHTAIFEDFDDEKQAHKELADTGELLFSTEFDPDNPNDKAAIDYFGDNKVLSFKKGEDGLVRPVAELAQPQALFVDTPSGNALVGAIDGATLDLSDDAKQELALEDEDRYGNGYAWLTRELAKSINRPEREVSFLKGDTSKIQQLEYTGDPAADLVIDLIKQVYSRGDFRSDVPKTEETVQMKDGNCKDAEVYFSDAQRMAGSSVKMKVNGKNFLHKKHGAETYINTESILFNGVELPPGFIFGRMGDNEGYYLRPSRGDDGGFYVMRATAFCFDDPAKAFEVFGSAMVSGVTEETTENLKQDIADFPN